MVNSVYYTEVEDEWLSKIEESYRELRIKIMGNTNELQKKEENVKVSKLELAFKDGISDLENLIRIDAAYELVERELSLLEKGFRDLGSELATCRDEEIFGKSSTCFKRMYSNIVYKATTYIKEKRVIEKQKDRRIKLDKIPLPLFDGSRRLYPKFRKDFTRLVLPNIAKAEAAFTLRQYVTKEVSLTFASCEDCVDEMLKKLDEKYGDVCQLIDVIISEIRMLKKLPIEDPQALINLVNIIQKGYNDLKNMDLEKEMCNATVIKAIENKLPRDVALLLFRKVYDPSSKIDRINKYPDLLEYLKIERDAREYGR